MKFKIGDQVTVNTIGWERPIIQLTCVGEIVIELQTSRNDNENYFVVATPRGCGYYKHDRFAQLITDKCMYLQHDFCIYTLQSLKKLNPT